MKHVRSLSSEPPLLAKYRANPAAGAQRPETAAAEVWARFRKREPDAYRELVEELARRQQGLCVYCEQRLVDEQGVLVRERYQVEHVVPKTAAIGLVLDWTNLALACWGTVSSGTDKSCGAAKGNRRLPDGCEPRAIPLLKPLLDVGTNGKLIVNHVNCGLAGVVPDQIETTIEILNLDSDRIRKPRQDAGDAIREKVAELMQALAAANVAEAQQQQAFEELIANRLCPNAAGSIASFWSAERSALGPPAEIWISGNQGLFQ
ncbi:MAG: retron system putative HNH endonuclease [Polyangiaceae bacterium]